MVISVASALHNAMLMVTLYKPVNPRLDKRVLYESSHSFCFLCAKKAHYPSRDKWT